MKILAVIIHFISVVAAVENLAGLPVERFQQVKRILSGRQNRIFYNILFRTLPHAFQMSQDSRRSPQNHPY